MTGMRRRIIGLMAGLVWLAACTSGLQGDTEDAATSLAALEGVRDVARAVARWRSGGAPLAPGPASALA